MIIPPSSLDPTHNKIDVPSFHHTALLLLLCYPSCSCHVVTFIYPMLAHTTASPPRVSSHHCALLYYYPCMHCSYIMTRRRLTLHFPQLSVSQLPLFKFYSTTHLSAHVGFSPKYSQRLQAQRFCACSSFCVNVSLCLRRSPASAPLKSQPLASLSRQHGQGHI